VTSSRPSAWAYRHRPTISDASSDAVRDLAEPTLRVAVDTTSLIGARTGVGTFTEELLRRLPGRPDLEVRAFAVTRRGARAMASELPVGVDVARRPMAARPLRWCWRRADLPPVEWWTGLVDVVHGPNFVVPPARRAAEVVTIHDLTCVRFPEMCTADTLQVPGLLERALRRGAWVHTVSSHVAAEVVEAFGADPERVVAIPNGAPSPIAPDRRPGLAARGRGRAGAERYVLALGTLEPRKDIPSLVRAFDALAADDPDLHLVLAGPDGWGADSVTDSIATIAARRRVHRLGWVGGVDREALLAGAAVVAYPSRYEGFGLPPLEALAAGTPVVATTAGALPEVLVDAAQWAPPGDVDALAGALRTVLDDPARAGEIVAAGAGRLAAFSWDRTADALVELYRRSAAAR
jgi:glycosyltransferase involved in cell wall biosynthesis